MTELINLAWVAVCCGLVFFMQAGFALVEGGLSRAKNAINVIMKVYLGTCFIGLLFWAVGNGLAFGSSLGGWIGVEGFAPTHQSSTQAVTLLYQAMFATTAVSIVSGAVAERMRYGAYLAFACLMAVFIYPVYAHWAWNPQGWLKQLGFIDFAGDGAVHTIGAAAALAGVRVLGPRLGRFGRQGDVRDIPGHNLPMVALGGFVLWLGWFGFNGGSVSGLDSANLGTVLLNTHLGACAGGLGALAFMSVTGRPILLSASINGSLCGLVAITGGAATLNPATAALTGFIGGILCTWGADWIRRQRLDDAVDAIAVHGLGGLWGLLAAGLFYDAAPFELQRLAVQALGGLTALAFGYLASWIGFKALARWLDLRAPTLNEQRGLDYTEHHELGYPEFQEAGSRLNMENPS